MRLFLVLTALACLLLSCGGDDYSTPGTAGGGGQPASKTPAAQPAKPEPKKETLSPLTAKVATAYDMTRRTPESAKVARARQEAEKYASQARGDAFFYLAKLWEMAEMPKEAADAFVAFVKACPTDKNYKWGLYGAADMLAKSDRVDEATPYVESFMEKAPEEMKLGAQLAEQVGTAFLKEAKFDPAAKMFETAAKGGRWYGGLQLVNCLCAKGDYAGAKKRATSLAEDFTGKEAEALQAMASRVGKMGKKIELDVEGWTGRDDFDLSTLAGKVTLVYFWKMPLWNLSRRTEKELTKLYDRYRDEGFEIVGLSQHYRFDPVANPHQQESMTTEDEVKALDNWVYNWKIPWRLGLCQDRRNEDAFGVGKNFPTFVLLDHKGVYRWYLEGESKPREEKYALLAAVIEILLDEK